jgi:hypothetical protein
VFENTDTDHPCWWLPLLVILLWQGRVSHKVLLFFCKDTFQENYSNNSSI